MLQLINEAKFKEIAGLDKPTISKKEKQVQEQRERMREFQREVAGFLFDLGFEVVVRTEAHPRK